MKISSMKILSGLVVFFSLSVSSWAVPTSFGGHYYDIVLAPRIDWDSARIGASGLAYLGLPGHLVTITSAGEHTFVNTLINANGGGEMWAGGYQPAGETNPTANWTWLNGEGSFPGFDSTSPYAHWNPGEPNDGFGLEQHLGLNWFVGWFNDEADLSHLTGYVVEFESPTTVPEGGSSIVLLSMGLAGLSWIRLRASRRS